MNEIDDIDNPFRYCGEYQDQETGYYYLRARYYDPQVQRFISRDSYEGNIYKPWTQNLYAYCNNNPVIFIDPSGHGVLSWLDDLADKLNDMNEQYVGGPANDLNEKWVGGPLNEWNEQCLVPTVETNIIEPINELLETNIVEPLNKGIDPQVISNVTEVTGNALDIAEGISEGGAAAGLSEAQAISSRLNTINPAMTVVNVATDINVQAHTDQSFIQGALKVGTHATIDIGTGAALKSVGAVYGAGFTAALTYSPIAAGGVAVAGLGKLGAICVTSNEVEKAVDNYIDSYFNKGD